MAVTHEHPPRLAANGSLSAACLEEKFELLKEIGDGSFGSVALARVRTAGGHIARRGTMVAIKTMKKTFESFGPCLELREVIFLRSLPVHPHLVPALEIFLDPTSKKLHICMEHMDGNLYQLMKGREHKCLDSSSVKSILFQILSGLDHIHNHNFFHRDIKPENILVSTSSPQDSNTTFRRYSSMVTPPSTPPLYTIKIADFGLAREIHSQHPYTTYVSTRWYRAPEVLLRAGAYSAPVDIWAIGAMAVEIANLKPLFPGGNEVDQVWRVCEIMGSPGNWYDKSGKKVGGGDWRDGTRLAQKLGFSFPKMAPHSMETILRAPQWPVALSSFVTWCLMWDPKNRPTSAEAMKHEYFNDAVDPLRPKSSGSRLLGRKHSSIDGKSQRDFSDGAAQSSRPSWFRKSLIRDHSPALPIQLPSPQTQITSPNRSPTYHSQTIDNAPPAAESTSTMRYRPFANKRATWTNGINPSNAAPMPILPSIRPISPLSDTVTAQSHNNPAHKSSQATAIVPSLDSKPSKKIGRQLSVQSNGNHYADFHRQEAERALNGQRAPMSPNSEQKEGFFSHLRKRARRLSGKPQIPAPPSMDDDVEANAGCSPWQSNRNSMIVDSNMDTILEKSFNDIDTVLQSNRPLAEPLSPSPEAPSSHKQQRGLPNSESSLSRHPSLSKSISSPALDSSSFTGAGGPISSRTRRALHRSTHPSHMYDTPDEEDELLHEALNNAQSAAKRMDRRSRAEERDYLKKVAQLETPRQPLRDTANNMAALNPYPTPSPSAKRNGVLFDQNAVTDPVEPLKPVKARPKEDIHPNPRWPTPPYEENEWAASAAASIFAVGSIYK